LFAAMNQILYLLILMSVIQFFELTLHDGLNYTEAGSSGLLLLTLIVKIGLLGWFFYLWIPVIRSGFQLSAQKAILGAVGAIVLSLLWTAFVLSFIFGLPLF
ncbi:MAG: hypothetical protein AAF570_06925, partial [Bacteroidota bacterium]